MDYSLFSPPKCEMIGGYLPASSKNSIFAVNVKRWYAGAASGNARLRPERMANLSAAS